MVTFIPPFMGEEIKSNAERKMYDVLQELDLKNACILHSLGLPKHRSKIYGEIDFVVVCERGVACLEIKGGRVECKEGRWFFTDRYGVEREKPESPFSQVTGNMFSLRDIFKQRFNNDQRMKGVLIACGVVFPDIEFKSRSQEIIPEIVFDKSTQNISQYINGIFDYWENRSHWTSAKLSSGAIKDIVNYLRGEFSFIPSLADRLDVVEKRLIRLTYEQAQIMEALAVNDHLMIEGNAGTGKTVLATDFACKKAEQGNKVLYLTFNKNLSNNLLEKAYSTENLKIINIHALFGEYVPVDLEQMQKNPQVYFARTLPDTFYKYISGLSNDELDAIRYDLLILDEGQDIIRPTFLFSLDYLLKGGLENGHWAVFYDEKQNIYNPEYNEGLELIEAYNNTKFKLFINCRNTVQIGRYIKRITGWELGTFLKENGEDVQEIEYSDDADFKKKFDEILKKLKSEKVQLKDVTFLAPKKYENSILGRVGIEVTEVNEGMDSLSRRPRFSTIHGYKGLDSKVIILCGLDDIRKSNYSRLAYIATTRARTLLYVVGSKDFWKEHKIEK